MSSVTKLLHEIQGQQQPQRSAPRGQLSPQGNLVRPMTAFMPRPDEQTGPTSTLIGIQFLKDCSTSFEDGVPVARAAQAKTLQGLLASPVELWGSEVEMATRVASVEYVPLREFKPLNIPVGPGSRHCEMLGLAMDADRKFLAMKPSALLKFIFCDGFADERPEMVAEILAAFRLHQTDNTVPVHVFVVEFGDVVNKEFTRQLSVHHPDPLEAKDVSIETVFENIARVVQLATKDRRALAKVGTLRRKDIEAAQAAL